MAKLVFAMMQSLDGYIAGTRGGPQLPPPGPELYRHFNDHVRGLAGILYGTHMYEVMRYWDDDLPDWGEIEHDFAAGLALQKSRDEVSRCGTEMREMRDRDARDAGQEMRDKRCGTRDAGQRCERCGTRDAGQTKQPRNQLGTIAVVVLFEG
jgi:hypothetical protein